MYECLRHSTHPIELGATMHEGCDTVLASHTRNHSIVTNVQARNLLWNFFNANPAPSID
jgi:hypothetical protein